MSALVLDFFAENLPLRPYHTDDLLYGLRIAGAERAKLARFIQHNQPHAAYWLVFDIDRMGAAIDWNDRNAPTPNITVKNQANGHAHLLYGLTTAIRTAPDGSLRALNYAAAVERGLCYKLHADTDYSGLICKNPLNAFWQVTIWRDELYTLDELADYVNLDASAPRRRDIEYGLGRNCHLFHKTRTWAYRAIRQGWPDSEQWLCAVLQRVEMYNSQLPVPLSLAECACIARSIVRYTSKNFSPEKFAEIQAVRGRKGGKAKGEAYSDKREQAIELRKQGLSLRAIAQQLVCSPQSVSNWVSK
ncbi:TPA: plasmid replication protein [Salmonella enterica subsp. diarizonae]|nr:plasmid replication protein [Salmonella enterica subsp. diarizonae]